MKVFYVSKASIVPAYQDKLHALGSLAAVEALIPAQWGSLRAADDVTNGTARIRAARVFMHGHNHFHVYVGAGAALRTAGAHVVHIDEEPYSAATFQLARMCRQARVPFLFFAWQNIDKTIPFPFSATRRYVFTHAAAAIAGSDRAADVLRAAGWRGDTAVVPQLGVNPERFRADATVRAAARAQARIPAGAFVIGFAGRLVREKGVDLLIDATVALGARDAYLLIIGDGPERARLEQQAAAHGIAERVRFVGAAGSLEMPFWLNALDTLVLPSRRTRTWAEQFGRVLIEAMACEVPVLGARSGEIANVIGDAGLTFAEDDVAMAASALARLHGDEILRNRLGTIGRERVMSRYTHVHIARATLDVYERMLVRPPAAVRA